MYKQFNFLYAKNGQHKVFCTVTWPHVNVLDQIGFPSIFSFTGYCFHGNNVMDN